MKTAIVGPGRRLEASSGRRLTPSGQSRWRGPYYARTGSARRVVHGPDHCMKSRKGGVPCRQPEGPSSWPPSRLLPASWSQEKPSSARCWSSPAPSPWLMAQLGFVNQLFIRRWYLTLTERRVLGVSLGRTVMIPLGRSFSRREEIIPPAQRAEVEITDLKRRPVWSSFRYGSPGTARPIRMNVHRIWRDDMDRFVGELVGQMRPPAPHIPQHARRVAGHTPRGGAKTEENPQPHAGEAAAGDSQRRPLCLRNGSVQPVGFRRWPAAHRRAWWRPGPGPRVGGA